MRNVLKTKKPISQGIASGPSMGRIRGEHIPWDLSLGTLSFVSSLLAALSIGFRHGGLLFRKTSETALECGMPKITKTVKTTVLLLGSV
jgi:hypothetical protein